MTDLPERIVCWPHGHWATLAGECLVTGNGGVFLRADTAIPRAEADAMVAAAFKKAADLHDWTFTDKRANRAYWQSDQIRALTPADARAAFEQAVQEAVEAALTSAENACVGEYLEDPQTEEDDAYQRAIADCIAAIRAIRAPQETSE